MNINSFTYIYLLGAGGIGMSALGRYFLMQGKTVGGYDKTSTTLTKALSAEGATLTYSDTTESFPEFIHKQDISEVLVVYTPAIPSDSIQLNYLKDKGYTLIKRSRTLGLIAEGHKTIAVAGTHGKTTTSTLIAHILEHAGLKPVAFLGGISVNYNTNYLKGKPESILIAEADEYDRSFLQLFPDTIIITSVDADHLDIYEKGGDLVDSFEAFAKQVKRKLILKSGLNLSEQTYAKATTYSTKGDADIQLINYKLTGDKSVYSVKTPKGVIENLELGLAGFHNVENSLAAIAVAVDLNIDFEKIKSALASFKGVKRRFEYIIKSDKIIYIDDYAHHPAELNACISSAREMYSGKKITGVFQPHLYSRTRDFMDEFASALSALDEIYLLDIYPAREKPIAGVDSQALLDKIVNKNKQLIAASSLTKAISSKKPEVLLTMGAGDIDQLVEPLQRELNAL